MEVETRIDQRLLERVARGRQALETVLFAGKGFDDSVGELSDRIVATNLETLYGKANLLQRVLRLDSR